MSLLWENVSTSSCHPCKLHDVTEMNLSCLLLQCYKCIADSKCQTFLPTLLSIGTKKLDSQNFGMTVQYFIAFFSEQAPRMEPHCLCRYNYQARLIAASQSFENKMINDLFVFNIKTISQCVYSLSALSQPELRYAAVITQPTAANEWFFTWQLRTWKNY